MLQPFISDTMYGLLNSLEVHALCSHFIRKSQLGRQYNNL